MKSFLWKLLGRRLFSMSYHNWYGYRRRILRAFGATVPGTTNLRPTVALDRPWNLRCGEFVLVGDYALILARCPITIGDRAVVSQRTSLLTEARDHTRSGASPVHRPITIGSDAWIATDSLVLPGVTIGAGAVIGARSMVDADVPAWTIAAGDPARPLKKREFRVTSGAPEGNLPGRDS
ncbi:MAG: colanic acid biosynthesis acetyltransferase WcaF [Phycisphaerae bacterium]|nr:colanic acid biosynthesis acetyltransferase WcaF [Phycisphaerae bacterium]